MNKHKYNQNKTNIQLSTSELNHHLLQGRRSRALARFLPTLNGRWNSSSQKSAFTVIEVVLVLAIAGLIFLMVFIALPALQRNQRDAQRKNDLSRVLEATQRYQANNRGSVPPPVFNTVLRNNYLTAGGGIFEDPDGGSYLFYGEHGVGSLPTNRKWWTSTYPSDSTVIYVFYGARCNGENTEPKSGVNNIAFSIVLESGGVYCISNN